MRLVLASRSPRRAALLRAAGFEFVVRPAAVDETLQPGETPEAHVLRLAAAKAAAVEPDDPDEVVLGADTVVVIDGDVLGKPVDQADAAAMLARLSGRTHEVWTGVAVRHGDRVLRAAERTRVSFSALAPDEIGWYVASGEARDKAGAYGIQGLASRFVDRVEGSYTNVVGLPVHAVHRLLQQLVRQHGC